MLIPSLSQARMLVIAHSQAPCYENTVICHLCALGRMRRWSPMREPGAQKTSPWTRRVETVVPHVFSLVRILGPYPGDPDSSPGGRMVWPVLRGDTHPCAATGGAVQQEPIRQEAVVPQLSDKYVHVDPPRLPSDGTWIDPQSKNLEV